MARLLPGENPVLNIAHRLESVNAAPDGNKTPKTKRRAQREIVRNAKSEVFCQMRLTSAAKSAKVGTSSLQEAAIMRLVRFASAYSYYYFIEGNSRLCCDHTRTI
jgi:hypothetical protein